MAFCVFTWFLFVLYKLSTLLHIVRGSYYGNKKDHSKVVHAEGLFRSETPPSPTATFVFTRPPPAGPSLVGLQDSARPPVTPPARS